MKTHHDATDRLDIAEQACDVRTAVEYLTGDADTRPAACIVDGDLTVATWSAVPSLVAQSRRAFLVIAYETGLGGVLWTGWSPDLAAARQSVEWTASILACVNDR